LDQREESIGDGQEDSLTGRERWKEERPLRSTQSPSTAKVILEKRDSSGHDGDRHMMHAKKKKAVDDDVLCFTLFASFNAHDDHLHSKVQGEKKHSE
jgi:hypothetical protein